MLEGKDLEGCSVVPEAEGPGGHWPPQYLADQLTLIQPGRADYPHLLHALCFTSLQALRA